MPDDPRGRCIQLLHLYDSSSAEWQLGKTKVRDRRYSHEVLLLTLCRLLHLITYVSPLRMKCLSLPQRAGIQVVPSN